jgi:hypothetical protein
MKWERKEEEWWKVEIYLERGRKGIEEKRREEKKKKLECENGVGEKERWIIRKRRKKRGGYK